MARGFQNLFYRCLVVAALSATVGLCAEPGLKDDHDGDQVTWRDAGGDATHRLDNQQRVTDPTRPGARVESLKITSAPGSAAYLSHTIPPVVIIPELKAMVWVKADRPGVQMLVRAVLPRSKDPRSGEPITLLMRGTQSSIPGTWQQLTVDQVPQQLETQVRAMRVELRQDIDAREAYLDQIVLNTYCGQGAVNVSIDDLEVVGIPRPLRDNQVQPSQGGTSGSKSSAQSKPPEVRLNGALITIDGKAFFPRGIQYQGESLAHLQRLGFNTIFLNKPPSAELCSEAVQLNMWLVAPPPVQESAPGQPPVIRGELGPEYDHVLAWDLGQGLSSVDLDSLIQISKQLRLADLRMKRLVLCGAEADLRSFSRHVDVLMTARQPLGSSLELSDYATWLRDRPRLARPGTMTWTMIQSQLPAAILDQQKLLSRGTLLPSVPDDQALRLLSRSTVAAGVRGICFQSNTRLDGTDAATRMRALTLALINLELDLIEPFAAGGTYSTAVTSTIPDIGAAVLQTDRAKLLLPMRIAPGSQCVARPATGTDLTFVVPGVSEAHEAFEITPVGIKRLKHKRVTGGISVTMGDAGLSAVVVLTQDPVVINSLTKRTQALSRAAAEWQRDLAGGTLALVESLDARLTAQGHAVKNGPALLSGAKQSLQLAANSLGSGDFATGYFHAQTATSRLNQLERAHWEAANTAGIISAEPLAGGFSSLPQHWLFMEELRLAKAGDNRLPSGDCEDLNSMVNAGWRHYQLQQPEVLSHVELSPQGAAGGRLGLHLTAAAANPKAPPVLIESAPVWITTAAVPVEPNLVWVVTGKVKVNGPVSGSVDGLMIIDSLGKEPMALRFGDTKGWQEFVFYRATASPTTLSVTFALTGLGDVSVDDVQIRPISGGPAPAARQADREAPPRYGLPPAWR